MIRSSRMLATISLASLCWILAGCRLEPPIPGSGVEATESRELAPFHSINVSGAARVYVRQGDEQQVTLTVDDNLLEHIETRVSGDTLSIRPLRNIAPTQGVTIDITTTSLRSISCAGSCELDLESIDSRSLGIRVSGSADVSGNGSVGELDVNIAGSADVRLSEMIAERASVTIAGSGDVVLHATKALDARIAGSGSVRYAGHPPDVHRSIAGSGSVEPLADESPRAEADLR